MKSSFSTGPFWSGSLLLRELLLLVLNEEETFQRSSIEKILLDFDEEKIFYKGTCPPSRSDFHCLSIDKAFTGLRRLYRIFPPFIIRSFSL